MSKKWDIMSATKIITSSGQTVSPGLKQIKIYKQPGIKVWGAIDYMCNTHGFALATDPAAIPVSTKKRFVQRVRKAFGLT